MKKILAFTIAMFAWFVASEAQAATLYAGSATQVVYKGQTFVLDWFLDTENVSINTVSLKIKYNKDILRISEAVPGNSLLSIWLKTPTVDHENGTIELAGGAPNGFTGKNVPIFRTVFEATGTGVANIAVEQNSVLLMNDGQGTVETLAFRPIMFSVVDENLQPSFLTSSTHPDQNRWYKERSVALKFNPMQGTEYSYSFSSNLEIFPDDVAEITDGNVNYDNLLDGIYYFKLNSKVGPSTWQEAGVYRVQIDSTPPEEFFPEIGTDENANSGKSFVSFSTLDKTSGIWHYELKLGLFKTVKNAVSPHILDGLIIGNKISVTAHDLAGNSRTVTIDYDKGIPVWPVILVLVVLVAGVWVVKRYYTNKK